MVRKPRRAAFYRRVSTDGQTVENQRLALEAVCEECLYSEIISEFLWATIRIADCCVLTRLTRREVSQNLSASTSSRITRQKCGYSINAAFCYVYCTS
jgi:DNA invertase Pin-like site-specific DNA recombinase